VPSPTTLTLIAALTANDAVKKAADVRIGVFVFMLDKYLGSFRIRLCIYHNMPLLSITEIRYLGLYFTHFIGKEAHKCVNLPGIGGVLNRAPYPLLN
jgi:hypothetical protein